MKYFFRAVLVLLVLAGCGGSSKKVKPAESDKLALEMVPVASLPGWRDDNLGEALTAFLKSCKKFDDLIDDKMVGSGIAAGKAYYWKNACSHTLGVLPTDADATRHFFEEYFNAYKASNHGETGGMFTGYYEPMVSGSIDPTPRFYVPLYKLPPYKRPDTPYFTRQQIDSGALKHQNLELVWLEDPVEAFFLQVQGSGVIILPDGTPMRIGFAGANGHPYTPIGKVLVDRGELKKEDVSMQSIKRWLRTHPEQAADVMEQNASYIFFRETKADAAVGTLGVPLMPSRSIAIDPRYIPLGAPVWVDTLQPSAGSALGTIKRTLMVAQDTGGAIKGPVRADIFFGSGPTAEALAGVMKAGGEYYVLLPKDMTLPKP